mgnify:CR=1 FL=1
MARITVEDCLEKIDNQYDLVLLAKERTVQLNAGSPMLVEEDNDKRTIISLREIGDGKIDVKEVEASAIKRLRKEPDEIEQQEETEEETNDDFENLYKGQVSKSGVAILPSKRTRRIPEVKKPSLADEALSELKAEQPEIKEENLETEEAPLELSETLSEKSLSYAYEMYQNGFWFHKNPKNGELVGDRLSKKGFPYIDIGENLALSSSVRSGHISLMNSESHKNTILDSEFKRVGIGIVSGPLGLIIVQIFSS